MAESDRIPVSARTLGRLVRSVAHTEALVIEFKADVSERLDSLETLTRAAGLNGHAGAIRTLAELADPVKRIASKADVLDKLASEREQRDAYDREVNRLEAHQDQRAARQERRWRWLKEPRSWIGHILSAITGAATAYLLTHHP